MSRRRTFVGSRRRINLLVRDGGVAGVVIRLTDGLTAISHEGSIVTAQSGALDAEVARYAAKASLAGLEFLIGIPGSIGGGLRMNAGAYGGEFKDIVITAHGFDRQGNAITTTPTDMGMAYRHTDAPADWIFTSATLQTTSGDTSEIKARMKEIIASRGEAQPRGVRTGGSTFANPEGGKAWREIDRAGCRGLSVGGAQISEKHCNFLINTGDATASDIETLGETVRARVAANGGPDLRWEIRRVGRPDNSKGGPVTTDRVAILMGGWTSEASVSRVSASFCGQAARNAGWDAIDVEVDRDLPAKLREIEPGAGV